MIVDVNGGPEPFFLDWPRDVPLPRVGEKLIVHLKAEWTFTVTDLSWDVTDPLVYPKLTVTVIDPRVPHG